MTIKPTPSAVPGAPSLGRSPSKKLWMAAIKPPMYSVAVMPILLGAALAFYQTRLFDPARFLTFVLSAILILAWENLSNDFFDAATGIDRNKAHSVVNLTGNRSLVFWLATLCLLLGIAGILSISLTQQDWTVLLLILGCCGLGYLYQGPPFRLGYLGLGEILCFFAFGPLAVEAAYYSQAQMFTVTASGTVMIAAIILGITTSLVLFCSHFHQIEDDLAAGKRSPIVRLGTQRSAHLLPWICGTPFGLILLAIGMGWFPLWSLLVLGSLPAAYGLCRHAIRYHDQPERVHNCKFIAIRFHFLSSVLLCVGLLLGAM
ncbi:MAG: 2-carboxy-1,4-naphthoquinone phytyltransferase [Cyanobacteria bacterium J06638_22]